jgi:hypothetical protein
MGKGGVLPTLRLLANNPCIQILSCYIGSALSDGQKVIRLRNPVNFELLGVLALRLMGGLSGRRKRMEVVMFCKKEAIVPWTAKTGQVHKPLVLTLDDQAAKHPMSELLELRIEDAEIQVKLTGKCVGKFLVIGVDRVNKNQGIGRFEGEVLEVDTKRR